MVAMSNEPHWTDPGAYPVADGIHRIPLPLPMDGLKAINVYVIETETGLTLVDGGWALEVSRKQLEESMRTIGHHPRDITSFLVTHAHRDHYTQAVAIRSEFGNATVALGFRDKATLDLIHADLTEDPFVARVRACGAAEIAHAWADWVSNSSNDPSVWAEPDVWLDRDQTLTVGTRSLRAVSTPGHTAGHYVFADVDSGLLFAGDHVLPTITPSVGFEATFGAQPLRDFLASLLKVRALPDLQLLPAHGDTGMSSHTRVGELLEFHDHRLELCMAAVESGLHTSYDVAKVLPWTRHNRTLAQLDVFNSGMAVMETLVHLDLLWLQGKLSREEVDGVFFYKVMSQS
jgi:glyoxylase-like metal-dependent hydrolase (beta-lactamase superfamily II)